MHAALLVRVGQRPAVRDEGRPDRHAVDREPLQPAEVGQGQDAQVVARMAGYGHGPRCVADPALEPEALHPHPGPDHAAGDRSGIRATGAVEGRLHVDGLDLARACRIEIAVVALGHDRHQGVVEAGVRNALDEDPDGRVIDPADRHRRGQEDRRLDHAPLADRGDPDHLAGPIEDGCTGGDPVVEQLGRVERDDRGDAGPGDAPAGRRSGLVPPDRGVADADPGHVDDRVGGSRRQQPDPDAQLARTRAWRGAAERGLGRGAIDGDGQGHLPSMPPEVGPGRSCGAADAQGGTHGSCGPDRAGLPIQTWPSANCSAFQIGARALSSSIP